jgi:hypothetical protein
MDEPTAPGPNADLYDESGYWQAIDSGARVWGDPRNCRLCARQEPHSYRSHEQSVHASRVARMED